MNYWGMNLKNIFIGKCVENYITLMKEIKENKWRCTLYSWMERFDISNVLVFLKGISSFSCGHSVVSDSLQPHGLQHTKLPCLSAFPPLLNLMSIESEMPSNHLVLCCPLFLPSICPSIVSMQSQNQFVDINKLFLKLYKGAKNDPE